MLRLRWFKKQLGQDSVDRAKIIFEHVFQEYESHTTSSAKKQPKSTASKSDIWMDDLLDAGSDSDGAATATKSELQRYIDFEGPKCAQDGSLRWWKVRSPMNVLQQHN